MQTNVIVASFFKLKNTSHHVITWGVSLQVFLQLETLKVSREENQNCAARVYNSAEVHIRQY